MKTSWEEIPPRETEGGNSLLVQNFPVLMYKFPCIICNQISFYQFLFPSLYSYMFLLLLLLLLLLCCLLAGPRTYGRYLCSIKKTVVSIFFDLQLPPLAPNISSCFSNHLGAVFFFFLLLSLPSSVLQWHHQNMTDPIGFTT